MGVTGNGDYLFWVTQLSGAPDHWTISVSEALRAPWFTYNGTVTAFLVDVLSATVRIPMFLPGLLDGGIAFTPAQLQSTAPTTAPPGICHGTVNRSGLFRSRW
ncbi:hypothetical protein NPS70_27205 [Streptomyces sp. C10-9-1]|uniref:hypothetical protein n=1 Tax=Streptomyces sp. C10-9-1 TaxID=1859285 RepID=UPI0021114B67|nr:hypothetical protein [Streptomyces sp. C10-9-1]MCQ6556847.1 hypothetical protein [Streptomyces sp. C10-9-1]